MKCKAQNLRVGNKIKVAGTTCGIKGVQLNNRDGIVLNLIILNLPYPTSYGVKSARARRRTEVTVIIPRKAVLKLVK